MAENRWSDLEKMLAGIQVCSGLIAFSRSYIYMSVVFFLILLDCYLLTVITKEACRKFKQDGEASVRLLTAKFGLTAEDAAKWFAGVRYDVLPFTWMSSIFLRVLL